jgi:hypothetical protein
MKALHARFQIIPYANPRTESKSWRVTGTKRDGTRVRENFAKAEEAQQRLVALEAEYLARQTEVRLVSTTLTEPQIRLAELAIAKLPEDADLPLAVDIRRAVVTGNAACLRSLSSSWTLYSIRWTPRCFSRPARAAERLKSLD